MSSIEGFTLSMQSDYVLCNCKPELLRKKAKKVAGLVHGNRGRSPSNKIDKDIHLKILELSQGNYRDFNDLTSLKNYGNRDLMYPVKACGQSVVIPA